MHLCTLPTGPSSYLYGKEYHAFSTYPEVIATFGQCVSVISGKQEQRFVCLVSKSLPSSHWCPPVGSLVSVLHENLVPMGNCNARTYWDHFSETLAKGISVLQYNPVTQSLCSWDPQTPLCLFLSRSPIFSFPTVTPAPPTHGRIGMLTDKGELHAVALPASLPEHPSVLLTSSHYLSLSVLVLLNTAVRPECCYSAPQKCRERR